MFSDRAERAAAKAATHDTDRKADHLIGWNTGIAAGGTRDTAAQTRYPSLQWRAMAGD